MTWTSSPRPAAQDGAGDRWALWALQALGCDLGYMGARFIATAEANAVLGYKDMIVDSGFEDIHLTNAFSGLPTNMMRKSMIAQGLHPAGFGLGRGAFAMGAVSGQAEPGPRRYRTSGAQGTPCRECSTCRRSLMSSTGWPRNTRGRALPPRPAWTGRRKERNFVP
jgi:hypothetical protein